MIRHCSPRGARVHVALAVCIAALLSCGGTLIQRDWSGESGVTGPVKSAGDSFTWQYGCAAGADGSLQLGSSHGFTGIGPVERIESISVADVDSDGDGDLIIQQSAPAYTREPHLEEIVLLMRNLDGRGSSWSLEPVLEDDFGTFSPHSAGRLPMVVDLDSDGGMDILLKRENRGSWLMQARECGSGWIASGIDSMPSFSTLDVADFDLDGLMDIVVIIGLSRGVCVYLQPVESGDPWVFREIGSANDDYYTEICASDLDGDGDEDVFCRGYSQSCRECRFVLFENLLSDTGRLAFREIESDTVEMKLMENYALSDMNGDLVTDLLCCLSVGESYSRRFGTVCWIENPLFEDRVIHVIVDSLQEADVLGVADIDGDGELEPFGSHFWWDRPDDSEDWTTLNTLDRTVLAAGDVDGDGCDELITRDIGVLDFGGYSLLPGVLLSSVMELGGSAAAVAAEYSGVCPQGTSMGLQVRHGKTVYDLGPWSNVPLPDSVFELDGSEGSRFFQYMVTLSTTDARVSPALREVRLFRVE